MSVAFLRACALNAGEDARTHSIGEPLTNEGALLSRVQPEIMALMVGTTVARKLSNPSAQPVVESREFPRRQATG